MIWSEMPQSNLLHQSLSDHNREIVVRESKPLTPIFSKRRFVNAGIPTSWRTM